MEPLPATAVAAAEDQSPVKRASAAFENDAPEKRLKVTGEGVETDSVQAKATPKKLKFALFLSYRGTNYFGMQINKDVPTVEKMLLDALRKRQLITAEERQQPSLFRFQRAARTDRGVSAVRQLCSMFLPLTEVQCSQTVTDLNELLPTDIRVMDLMRVTRSFDAKNWCFCRTYVYALPSIAFAPPDQQHEELENFRVSEEQLKKVNHYLGYYTGTHNFYNFTSGSCPETAYQFCRLLDLTITRVAKGTSWKQKLFQCGEPYVMNGIEFLSIEIRGQSFMLHQIRKMVGLCISIVRGLLDESFLQKAWLPDRCNIPKAPSLGLFLNETHFDLYNKRFSNTHKPIVWDYLKDQLENFKQHWILSHIAEVEKIENSMVCWLESLPTFYAYDNDVPEAESNSTKKNEDKEQS